MLVEIHAQMAGKNSSHIPLLSYNRRSWEFFRILANFIENKGHLRALSIVARGHSKEAFECLCKVALALKTDLQCHLAQWQIRLCKKIFGPLQAFAQHKLMRSDIRRLSKQPGKMIGAVPNLLSKRLERQRLSQMSQNILIDPFHLLMCEP